jgi:hypothetical protein
MKKATTLSIMAFILSLALVSCEKKMELVDEGHITVSGGCLFYATGKIVLKPKGEFVAIEVENSGHYFYVVNQPIEDFEVILTANKVEKFLKKIRRLDDHPKEPKGISSRNARVEIFLPLGTGVLEKTWREMDLKYDIEPLLKEIDNFVTDCHTHSKKNL